MAVREMQKLCMVAYRKDRKRILEIVQRRGFVEVKTLSLADEVYYSPDRSAGISVLERNNRLAEDAAAVLEEYRESKKSMLESLAGRKAMTVEEYHAVANRENDIMRAARRLNELPRLIAEKKAEVLRNEAQLQTLGPWLRMELPMSAPGTVRTVTITGVFQKPYTLTDLYALLAEELPDTELIHIDVVSVSKEQTCLAVLCMREDAAKVEEALRRRGFALPPVLPKLAPKDETVRLEKENARLLKEIDEHIAEIKSMTDMLPDIRLAADYYAIRLERYKVETRIAQTKNTFVLTGYIAAEDAEKLKKELEDQFDIQIDTCEPDAEEEAPVAIKNNAFAAPVESVIEAYSYPSKGEIDPTAVTAVFYYILFGMMLGDAGYGILMVLVCGALLLKFRNMETGMKRTLGMFFYSGISTIFWGVMFGSFFGDAVTVISTTFFKNPIVFKPILMDPLSNAMSTLLFCLSVGIVHIYTGLIMKLIVLFKQKLYIEALYDVISWMVLVGGLLIILISSAMFGDIAGSTIPMPNFVLTVSKVGALLSSVVILLTSGRSSRNWFKRLLKGAYGLYNITGYLSDILSYSRLLALGLATSAIGSVINKMGAMFGDGIIGLIGFSIVFIIGHLLNMAINLLGAYVHTNRLQFVEFFGKFYEGGGRKFEPFAVNSKYYNFAEETK